MNDAYNDRHFTVSRLAGRNLLRLCAAVDPDSPFGDPLIVYAKLDNPQEWHRFFLDTGVAFWDIYDDTTVADELSDTNFPLSDVLDCSVGYTVNSAFAFERSPKHPVEIRVELSHDTSVNLRCRDDRADGGMELTIEHGAGG